MIDEALARIDAFVQREMDVGGDPPGLSLAITDAGQMLAVRTYGYADLEARLSVAPDHLFQIASVSKSFAAFIVMQEVEAGRLRLEIPVTEYVPWLKIPSRFGPVTLHHLLSHTAGICDGSDAGMTAAGEVFALRETETAWAPGSKFWYSNAGYKIIGLVLERITGRPFTDLLRERIFQPNDMASSEPATVQDLRPRLAVGYQKVPNDRPEVSTRPWARATYTESASADGSICSTSEDMATYARLILNRGRGPAGALVSEAGFDYMIQRIAQDPEEPTDSYGFGLKHRDENGRTFLGHSGGVLGYTSGLWTENGLGAVAMQNSESGVWWLVPYVLEVVAAALAGRSLPEPPPHEDRSVVATAADYVGYYRSGEFGFEVSQDGSRVFLDGVSMERVANDMFATAHPSFDRYHVCFTRESGMVTEASYGGVSFTNARHSGYSPATAYPGEWDSLAGHYRSNNPWFTGFRVYVLRGVLTVEFSSTGLGAATYPLRALPNGAYAMDGTPERIRFDMIIDGVAQRAAYMGQNLYRFFTP